MDEQVKYTEQDLERARYWVNWPSEHPSSVMAVRLEEVADLIHDVRAEAQPNHLTAAVNARLAAAEKLAQVLISTREWIEHGMPVSAKWPQGYALPKIINALAAWKEAAGK